MSRSILASCFNIRSRKFFVSTIFEKQTRKKHHQSKALFVMNEAYVRFEDGDETFQFTFRYSDPELNVDRQFNMSRRPVEPIQNFLKRIDANVDKVVSKKKRKKLKKLALPMDDSPKQDNVEIGNIALLRNDSKINPETTCRTLFQNTSELSLRIFGNRYKILMNVPWITEITLAASILAGFPTYPTVFKATSTKRDKSTFVWYKSSSATVPDDDGWEEVGRGYMYTPSSSEINCRLKLRCTPANDETQGPSVETVTDGVVNAGPGELPFETRHSFTRKKLNGINLRVTSYNILADVYASTDYSQKVLFPYCPPYALAIDYRKQLVVKELLGYNSDVICLQEVDGKVFEADLLPALSSVNYGGVFTRKGEDLMEGVATFWDERRFENLGTESRVMNQNVDFSDFANVWREIVNDVVKERFLGRNTTVQATVLRSRENPSKIIVVGNTHLYFQPDADHIRLLQGFYTLTYCREIADRTREKLASEGNVVDVGIIICGDFNSTPDCGIYQLMTTGRVNEDHKDWRSNPEQIVENVSLKNELSLASACGTPDYTNFTVEFADCLDYIYYQTDKMEVSQVVPFPSKEELSLNGAIPSPLFPSDHIALCADLKWTTE